jgi:hypothetical protein
MQNVLDATRECAALLGMRSEVRAICGARKGCGCPGGDREEVEFLSTVFADRQGDAVVEDACIGLGRVGREP